MNNLYEFYKITCDKFSDEMLFDNELSYKQVFELAELRAIFLKKQGFKKNNVIGILAENSKEWCISYMAITMLGCIALPMDPNLSPKELANMIKASKAKAVFISDIYKKLVSKIKKYPIDLNKSIAKSGSFKPSSIKEAQTASMIFTSGTTGKPKIVPLTHANIFNTSISTAEFLGLSTADHFLNILPLFHAYAFVANFTGPFSMGSSFYFLRSLKGPDIVRTLKEQEFTVFPAAPQLWELFMDSILNKAKAKSKLSYKILTFVLNKAPVLKKIGLGFLVKGITKPIRQVFGEKIKFFVSGGAPLKQKYFNYYNNMGLCILEGYGLSETTGPISISHMNKNKSGAVGPPMKGNEVKIKNINEDGIGEIWVRGKAVMPGYYKNPKLNKQVFDKYGWFNTGDLGRVDDDNYIFVTGRNKNLIVLDSGKNVYPEELESFYKKSNLISEICVFGKKVNDRETVHAVIVPASNNDDIYDIISQEISNLNRGLPTYKRISGFSISIDPLPINSTRKVLVHAVKENVEKGIYQSNPDEAIVLQNELNTENKRQEEILKLLKLKLKTKKIYSKQSLSDFGIDSLGLIDIISFIEENYNLSIDPDKARNIETFQEFLTYLDSCPESEGNNLDEKILKNPKIKRYFSFQTIISDIFVMFIRMTFKACWKIEIKGIENLKTENLILAPNHQSNLDYPALFSSLDKKQRRKIFVIGKKELSFLKFIFPASNTIWVDRKGNIIPSLKASADVLRQNKSICIFPEGTRSNDGNLSEFKTGAAYLSKNLKKKIVPVAIKGTYEILPKGKFFPRFFSKTTITVTYLKPLNPVSYKTIEEINNKIFNDINKVLKK